jgi:hypothetical protein
MSCMGSRLPTFWQDQGRHASGLRRPDEPQQSGDPDLIRGATGTVSKADTGAVSTYYSVAIVLIFNGALVRFPFAFDQCRTFRRNRDLSADLTRLSQDLV